MMNTPESRDTETVKKERARWGEDVQDRDEQYRLKRQALLRTAVRLFNEYGFHTTSLNDLAKRLNVTKPTLYYYFKSKDEILLECERLGMAHLKEAVDLAENHSLSGIEKLRLFFTRYAEMSTTDFGKCIVLTGLGPLDPESKKEIRGMHRTIDNALRTILVDGVNDGSIARCDPKMTAFALFGALHWICLWYKDEGPLTPQQIAEKMLAFFEQGLLPHANGGGKPKNAGGRTARRAASGSPKPRVGETARDSR